MKKMLAILLTLIMTLSLVACGKAATTAKPKETEGNKQETATEEEMEEPQTLPGGWAAPESMEITPEIRTMFEKAVEGLIGVSYEPIACIATQVVSGRNYMIVAKMTIANAEGTTTYGILTIYEDLKGNVQILQIFNTDAEIQYGGALGGWTEAENPAVPEEAAAALEKACEDKLGATYKPVALIASQVVSGTNYCLLCEITPVTPNAEATYALVTVYADLNGGAEITATNDFVAAQ